MWAKQMWSKVEGGGGTLWPLVGHKIRNTCTRRYTAN